MKRIIFSIAITLFLMNAYSQKESFDMASFVTPAGWQRTDSNGIVLLQQAKTANGLTSFCQIFLCPSQASGGNAAADFNNGWNARIVKYMGANAKPKTEVQLTPDGWTETTGATTLTQQGITFTCMLISITGHNRVMQFIVNMAGQDYADDVQVFFQNMDLNPAFVPGDLWNGKDKPPASAETGPGSLSDYEFTTPPGWATAKYSDGIVLSSPVSNTGEKCVLSLWPMRPAGNDLLADANNMFAEVFRQFQPRNDGMTQNSILKGVSPLGWEYLIVKRSIGLPGSMTT